MGKVGICLFVFGFLIWEVRGQSEAGLAALHSGLAHCDGQDCKDISDSLASDLERLLLQPEAWEGLSAKTQFMATVESADGRLKVLTWNWPHEDRTSSYAGLIAFRDAEDADVEFTRLHDPSSADRPEEDRILKPEDWNGALYYAIVPDAVDKDVWLMLGWDDADAQVNRKVIEPIRIAAKGPRFGAPMLQSPTGMRRRHVLEYADAVQASLRYQAEAKGRDGHEQRLVFDHLAPREPHLSGISAYYGPDMTFDAYVPQKRGAPWVLQEDVGAAQTLSKDRPFVDPRPRNAPRNRR